MLTTPTIFISLSISIFIFQKKNSSNFCAAYICLTPVYDISRKFCSCGVPIYSETCLLRHAPRHKILSDQAGFWTAGDNKDDWEIKTRQKIHSLMEYTGVVCSTRNILTGQRGNMAIAVHHHSHDFSQVQLRETILSGDQTTLLFLHFLQVMGEDVQQPYRVLYIVCITGK